MNSNETIFWILITPVLLFTVNKSLFAQANSVELQDGNGVLISSHSSIEEAYNSIPATITQAYIVEILASYDGTLELFPIDLTVRSGSSFSNTVTIRPGLSNQPFFIRN